VRLGDKLASKNRRKAGKFERWPLMSWVASRNGVPLIGGENGWDQDELVNKRVHVIAKAHSCSIDDVHAALDRHPIELNRDAYLKRTLSLELIRLDELEMAFQSKALKDKDVPAGALMVKIAERRATLLALNPPLGHAVHVVQHEPATRLTSTEKMSAVLDTILYRDVAAINHCLQKARFAFGSGRPVVWAAAI
jgi:hypothetical protein